MYTLMINSLSSNFNISYNINYRSISILSRFWICVKFFFIIKFNNEEKEIIKCVITVSIY